VSGTWRRVLPWSRDELSSLRSGQGASGAAFDWAGDATTRAGPTGGLSAGMISESLRCGPDINPLRRGDVFLEKAFREEGGGGK